MAGDLWSTLGVAALSGILSGSGFSAVAALRRERREDRLGNVTERRARLDLAQLIEDAATEHVASMMDEVAQLRTDVDRLRSERDQEHRARVALARHVEDLHEWIAGGSQGPMPAMPQGVL